jgi:hypothetical protein
MKLEGAFFYDGAKNSKEDAATLLEASSKHVFLTSTTHINVCPANDNITLLPFQTSFMKRRPSASRLCQSPRTCKRIHPFSFELPRSCRPGEDLPCSFSSSKDFELNPKPFAITYKVLIHWEPSGSLDNSSRSVLTAIGQFKLFISP